ncbi:MAG: TonB-dependent receptor [candidate division KSB1 bacterium]|nr:TonB-dependent receptor [candidate division KSB1 bacterium]
MRRLWIRLLQGGLTTWLGVQVAALEADTLQVDDTKRTTELRGEQAQARQQSSDGEKSRRAVDLGAVVVRARQPMSSASSEEIRARDFLMRPRGTLQEILNNVPGLVVAQHQGGGKAPQWLVRGFDGDHGTDFAVFVDDMPVNLVSHAHGQGYADVNFVIPETIQRLQLYKGPYFPDFGDFANAGALQIVTKEEFSEPFALAEGGSFATHRYVFGASPRLGEWRSLIAAQAYFSDGPFEHAQGYSRYNLFAKVDRSFHSADKLTISAGAYAGDWDASGQIPLRAVAAGRLALAPLDLDPQAPTRPFHRFDAIDPTEGGRTDREFVNVRYSVAPREDQEWSIQAWGQRYKLALFSNFTFYKDTGLRFVERAGRVIDVAGEPIDVGQLFLPGDGIEQNDSRILYGGRLQFLGYWFVPGFESIPLRTRVALETRHDHVHLHLYRQVRRQRFFTVNAVAVEERSLGAFGDQQVFLTDWLRLEVGLRGDVFFFDGRDRLPPGVGLFDPLAETCVGQNDPNFCAVRIHGSVTDSIVSPKANLILSPLETTDVYLNFGTGFHSNDARNAILAKNYPSLAGPLRSPLTRSLGYEVGTRTRQFDCVDLAAALWLLDLDSELVFSGDAGNQQTGAGGTFEPAGKTRRWGIDFEARYEATQWLLLDYDLAYADPRFRKTGEAIPLAPTLLMNGGITVRPRDDFEAALRVRYLGDRPAIEDRSLTARGYTLVDLLARYRWRNVEASLALLNLLDRDWREAQFSDTSCLLEELQDPARHPGTPCSIRPGLQGTHEDPAPDIHFTPGNPFWARGGIAVYF